MNILIKFAIFTFVVARCRAELTLLSVVFRHGDRTPESAGLEKYKSDPYANETFFPIGGGGLTNAGKKREYRFGQFLRKEYNDFLGPFYIKGSVSARSTFIERTRQSLQLVLAGLYPPRGNQTWNQNVNWQPIPTTYIPHLDDVLMFGQECPKFLGALERVRVSSEFRKKLDKFVPLMKSLTMYTGQLINTTDDMYFIYQGLEAAYSMNLKLPKWTSGIFPDGELHDGALLEYELFGFTDELRRLNGGMYVRKFVDDMTAACENRLEEPRKIFLYSGHEFSVVGVLQSLNAYKPHIPRYSSAVIVELHKENGKCLVKVKYYKGVVRSSDKNKSMVEKVNVAGFSKPITLDEFKRVLKNHTATDDDITSCDKRSIPEFIKTHINVPRVTVLPILQDIEKEKKNQPNLY